MFDFLSWPPAFMPLPVDIPPPPVPLVGDRLEPTFVPRVPFAVAPATAARVVALGISEPPPELWAKLAVKAAGASIKDAAMAMVRSRMASTRSL